MPPRKNGQWLETETSFFTAVTFEKVMEAVVVQPKPQLGSPFPSISLSFTERKELEEGVFSLQVVGFLFGVVNRLGMRVCDVYSHVNMFNHGCVL